MTSYEHQVRGAFAWAFLDRLDRVRILLDLEQPFSHFARAGAVINVVVEHPWDRPDPRGPGKESTSITWDARGRPVRARPPLRVQTPLALGLGVQELAWNATLARETFDCEYERGYAIIRSTPPPPRHVSRAPRLLEAAPVKRVTFGFDPAYAHDPIIVRA